MYHNHCNPMINWRLTYSNPSRCNLIQPSTLPLRLDPQKILKIMMFHVINSSVRVKYQYKLVRQKTNEVQLLKSGEIS